MWKSLPSLQPSSLLAVILPFLLLMCSLRQCGAKPKGDVCHFNGQQYQVGNTFHPKVSPADTICVNCSCVQGGNVICAAANCPKPDCENPKYVAGKCCPVCDVEVEVDNPQITPPPGCLYEGVHYEHEELFATNASSLTPLHADQCVLCQCNRGTPLCFLKKCTIEPNCLRTITVSYDCCQQCAEYKVDPASPATTPIPKLERLKPGDCMDRRTGVHRNGTTWKPVVVQKTHECVICKCLNGKVKCGRVQCPATLSSKCKRPQLRKCCKECPQKIRTERRVSTKDGKKKKCKKEKGDNKKKKRGKKKKKRRCKKNNKKSSEKSTVISNQETVGTLGNVTMDIAKNKLCVHKKADFVVYVVRGDNSFSLILDNLKSDGSWEKADWVFWKGFITSSKKSSLPQNSPLRQKINTQHLVGTSIKRNVKKFFKILEKKLQKCKKKCKRKVLERTMKRLKVKGVNLKKSC